MGALRAAAKVVASTSVVGCQLYARGSHGAPTTTIRHGEPITVRTDQLPGAGELLPDGRVRYIVAIDELCRAPKLIEERVAMKPAITPGGMAYFVGSSAFMVAGVGLIAHSVFEQQELGEGSEGRRVQVTIGVSSLIVGAALTGIGAARGRTQKRALLAAQSAPVNTRPDGIGDVPCKDAAAELGQLELSTPWNTKSTATPDANGAVTFDVVWVGEMLDPDAATAESLIAAPWKVAATNAKISTTWQPLGPQLPQALDIARAAKRKAATTKTE